VPPEVVVEVARPAKAAEPEVEEEAEEPSLTPEELADAEQHKAMGILAYICFVIPLMAAPKSGFARFHANQGLISFLLWVAAVAGCVVCSLVNMLVHGVLANVVILTVFFGCLLQLLQPVMLFGALAMTVMGIVNAANGEKKALPVVGNWRLIK
jgi:uncharacterized membrane protein